MNVAEKVVWLVVTSLLMYVIGLAVHGYVSTPPYNVTPPVYCTMDQTSVPC